ncbi:MAG: NAD(P)/FAD-dependent oxidoreductase [Planctomycetes bacterium]|nr:NAD(P)/FAD-dependent oxidoreductase [Planctomycetota bacterium]
MIRQADPDVVVIGGGPAGATTAALIAERGSAVVLFERERFPRYHIGESLIPETFWVLERLGILPHLRGGRFVEKHSVQFVSDQGKLSAPFYFADYKDHESSRTWQVNRAEFDRMMLDNARSKGVEVHEAVRVLEVLFENGRAVGVRVADGSGGQRIVRCRVVVDAAGQSTLIQDRLGLRRWDPDLKKAAIWTYWRGAVREKGRDAGATLVLQTEGKKGWFWYIPLADNVTSVGVVADHDHLFDGRAARDPAVIYAAEVGCCPGLVPRLAGAERIEPFRIAKEYSYRSRQVAGDGWVLVGDALGFLDPLYSSGVLLALKSGALAADAISAALERGDTSAAALGPWGPRYLAGMDRMRKLVCAFYEGLNFGQLVRRHEDAKPLITDILIGDIFKEEIDGLWPLLAERDEADPLPAATGI